MTQLTVFVAIFIAVGIVNSAPTREWVNYGFIPVENYPSAGNTTSNWSAFVGTDCISIIDTSLPKRLKLHTNDPDAYIVRLYESEHCNDEIINFRGSHTSENMILNDRHPICSFKLNFNQVEGGQHNVGSASVAFHTRNATYRKGFQITRELHNVCDSQFGGHRFAQKINVYSDNPDITEIEVFHVSNPDESSPSVIVGNGTDLVQKTVKLGKIARYFKITRPQ